MKTLRLLSMTFVGSALLLTACPKADDPTDSTSQDDIGDDTTDDGGTDFGETTTDEGDDTTTDGGTMFVPEEDLGNVSTCDPWMQDCPDGEKCVAYASSGGTWDANKCVPIGGDGATGDPCTYAGAVQSTDDCDADSWCWDANEEGVGTCTSFCTGTPDDPVCDPGASCSIANNGSINLCLVSCDVLLQDCPVDGTACFFDGNNFVCANATSNIPFGEPCGFINDCNPGSYCGVPEATPNCAGAGCCVEFCDMADPQCSLNGVECTAFYEEGTAPPGLDDLGACVVPG